MRGLIFLWMFGVMFSFFGCAQEVKPLATQQQFDSWSSLPLYQKYGQVSSLKVVYDVAQKKVHFVSSDEYEYHYEFCTNELGYRKSLNAFNEECYSGDDNRPFLLANINFYKALNTFALELGPSDRMNVRHLKLLFNSVKKNTFFGHEMMLMANSEHVSSLLPALQDEFPVLLPSDVYRGQKFQPISKVTGYGRVVVITDWETQSKDIRPTDILLLKEIPVTFPIVSGVMVTSFQTPLSHVSILGHNRKIPICAYTELFEKPDLLALDGKTVEFSVTQDTFLLISKQVDLSKLWKGQKEIRLKADYSVDSLIPVKYLHERQRFIVGNKAANFGELYHFSEKMDFKVPESAFAIPFSFYRDHTLKSAVPSKVTALLRKDNLSRSSAEIRRDLEEIQALILNTPLDSQLEASVVAMIERLGEYRRMRFRSSTNAEDSEGFSGAGLYTSKTGEVGSEKKPIDKAIKKVWASLWSYEAFMEREAFNIDHATVAMGILVHRSFPEEAVNGVAITTNLYRKNYLGFVINAQLGDESVVAPKKGVECDQFICYPDETSTTFGRQEGGIDIINYSSLNNGKLTMTKEEIQLLANQLELIKRKYLSRHYTGKNFFDFGLDLEFKLDKDTRQLYIKQMRVFNN